MKEFQGKKWRYDESTDSFRMTSSYIKFLKERELEKSEFELRVLKESLEYQQKTYGEVDKIQFDYFVSLVTKQSQQKGVISC